MGIGRRTFWYDYINMKLLTPKLIKWTILWLTTWGVAQLLWGGDPLLVPSSAVSIFGIFLLAISIAFVLFPEERKIWLEKAGLSQTLTILLIIVAYVLLDNRLIIGSFLTSGHVLFQQLMLAVLVFMVPSERFVPTLWRVLFFFWGQPSPPSNFYILAMDFAV